MLVTITVRGVARMLTAQKNRQMVFVWYFDAPKLRIVYEHFNSQIGYAELMAYPVRAAHACWSAYPTAAGIARSRIKQNFAPMSISNLYVY